MERQSAGDGPGLPFCAASLAAGLYVPNCHETAAVASGVPLVDPCQALRRSQMLSPTKDMIDSIAASSRERDSVLASLARDMAHIASTVEELHV